MLGWAARPGADQAVQRVSRWVPVRGRGRRGQWLGGQGEVARLSGCLRQNR